MKKKKKCAEPQHCLQGLWNASIVHAKWTFSGLSVGLNSQSVSHRRGFYSVAETFWDCWRLWQQKLVRWWTHDSLCKLKRSHVFLNSIQKAWLHGNVHHWNIWTTAGPRKWTLMPFEPDFSYSATSRSRFSLVLWNIQAATCGSEKWSQCGSALNFILSNIQQGASPLGESMVSIASFKSSSIQHDVHLVNYCPI